MKARVLKAIVWLGLMGIAPGTNVAFAQGGRQAQQGNMSQGNMARGNMVRGDINPARPAPTRPRPLRPIFPLGFGGYGFGGYGFGGYDYDYMPQSPNIVVLEAPPPAYVPLPERPPETATMVIHEYQPLSAGATQAAVGDEPLFAIVLKNGTTLSASAVIVQNDGLHIVDPDGAHQRVSMDAVDREATTRVNRERKLQLQLPPGR
jgi:hypothetical protein